MNRALDELKADERAHLAECLVCLNDFARLQSLGSHPDPVRRRWLGGGGLQELGAFMLEHKKFWLLPIVGALVLFGGLVLLTQGSTVAPFIYALW